MPRPVVITVQNGGETAYSMKELIPIANKYLNGNERRMYYM